MENNIENPPQKRGCGCVGKGCLVLIIIGAVFISLGIWGYKKLAKEARAYTAGKSVDVPEEKVTQDEYDALIKRMDAFKNATGSDATLELTAHDLNLLLAFSPDWELVRGRIHASIENGELGLTGSIPLAYIPELRDQYLNGWIYFTPSMDDKVFHLGIQRIKTSSMGELSKVQVTAFSNALTENLTSRLLADPVLGPVLIKAKTLKMKDNVMVLSL